MQPHELVHLRATAGPAITRFYGDRFTALDKRRQQLLCADLAELAGEYNMGLDEAMRLLDRRIGSALESYADSLAAGANKRGGLVKNEQFGLVLVFRDGMSYDECSSLVAELKKRNMMDLAYYIGGHPQVQSFDSTMGGPVWYIP